MRIRITSREVELTGTLLDNPSTQDLRTLLPVQVDLTDFHGTEKISDLPRRLSTDGAPDGASPRAGDIALYAPWGNLAIFFRDFEYSTGLVPLGTIDTDAIPHLASLSGAATIELLDQR